MTPEGALAPFASRHEAIPPPNAPSRQPKLECTTCPTAYVAPATGLPIDADGAAATVYLTLALPVARSRLVAVTVNVCTPTMEVSIAAPDACPP